MLELERNIVLLEDGSEQEMCAKDGTLNSEGRKMMEWIEEEGLIILNGWKEEDDKGEWTFLGEVGFSTIDYGIVNGNAEVEVTSFRVGERTGSDHMPIIIEVGENREQVEFMQHKEDRKKVVSIGGQKRE